MQPFKEVPIIPNDVMLSNNFGWLSEINRCYTNDAYGVMVRTVNTSWGKVRHAIIYSVTESDITWSIKQQIKNSIFGKEKTAIEVFPAESNLVDAANLYHLWVLPKDFTLPFTICEEREIG